MASVLFALLISSLSAEAACGAVEPQEDNLEQVRLGWALVNEGRSQSNRSFNLSGLSSEAVGVYFEADEGASLNVKDDWSKDLVYKGVVSGQTLGVDCENTNSSQVYLTKVRNADGKKLSADMEVRAYEVVPTTAFPHRSWMGDHYSAIQGLTLGELTLAGAHDAGTYSMSRRSRTGEGVSTYWVDVTQGRSIAQQLRDGVRKFDLRFQLDGGSGEMRIMHGDANSKGERLPPILDDIATFLQAEPTEIVFVGFSQMYNKAGDSLGIEHHNNVAAEIRERFGSCIIPTTVQQREGGQIRVEDAREWLEAQGCTQDSSGGMGGVVIIYTNKDAHFKNGEKEIFFADNQDFWGNLDYSNEGGSGDSGFFDELEDFFVGDTVGAITDNIRKDLKKEHEDTFLYGISMGVHPSDVAYAIEWAEGESATPPLWSLPVLAQSLYPELLGDLMGEFLYDELGKVGVDHYHYGVTKVDGYEVSLLDHLIARNLGEVNVLDNHTVVELRGGDAYTQDEAAVLCRARGMRLATVSDLQALYDSETYHRCAWSWTADSSGGQGVLALPNQLEDVEAKCSETQLNTRSAEVSSLHTAVCVELDFSAN